MYASETPTDTRSKKQAGQKQYKKGKKVCQSKQFVTDWRVTWTGSMRWSGLAGPPWWLPPQNSPFMSTFRNLLDQRPGLIIVTTLVGFVLFDLSHVLWPSIALAWLCLQETRHKVITGWSQKFIIQIDTLPPNPTYFSVVFLLFRNHAGL